MHKEKIEININNTAMENKKVMVSINYGKQSESNEIHAMKRNKRLFTKVTFLCVINASLSLFGNGLFVGWSSIVMDTDLYNMKGAEKCRNISETRKYDIHRECTFSESEKWQIYSVIALTAACGPLIVNQIWHYIGSKCFILMANFLMVVAWILVMFNRENYVPTVIGRGVGGLSIGIHWILIPIYINDVVHVHQKPLCYSIMQLQFVFGILSQYILFSVFKSFTSFFLIINLLPAITSTLLFISFFFMPESPRYLSVRGNLKCAREILMKFKMTNDHDIQKDLQLWTSLRHPVGYLSAFKSYEFNIFHVIPVFGLHIFEQLIGVIPILFYLQKIFRLSVGCLNVNAISHPEYVVICKYLVEMSTILCVISYCVSILLPHFFDFIKINLMWSTSLMAGVLGVLGVFCCIQGVFDCSKTEDYRYVPVVCLALFYFLYAIGPQRFTNEYAEKVIPKKCYFTIRSMLATTSWFLIYTTTRMMPDLIKQIGVGYLFCYMAVICVLMAVFVKLFVVDMTSNEKLSSLLDNSSSSSSNSNYSSSSSNCDDIKS